MFCFLTPVFISFRIKKRHCNVKPRKVKEKTLIFYNNHIYLCLYQRVCQVFTSHPALARAGGMAFFQDSLMRLLLVDNYDSFTYNLYQAFLVLQVSAAVVRNDNPELETDLTPYDAIVISPGPGRPDDAGLSCTIIEKYSGTVPILGVCLGMQCINEVFGGTTVKADVPVHGKTSLITHDGSELYSDVPNPFAAARYHSLVIEPGPDLCLTSHTDDTIPMSVKVQGKPVWGIQYHPESFLTPHGPRILANFCALCQTSGDAYRSKPVPETSPGLIISSALRPGPQHIPDPED